MRLPVFVFLSAVLIVSACASLSPVPGSIGRLLHPVSASSLGISPSVLDLGTVELNELLPFDIHVTNRLDRTMEMDRPETPCSCIVTALEPFTIAPGATHRLRMTLRTPSVPGPFSRNMTLRTPASRRATWNVTVKGNVLADAWCSPASLQLTLDQGASEELAVIHFAEGVRPGKIVPSHPEVMTVQLSPPSPGAQAFTLRVASHTDGAGHIYVFDQANKTQLASVPVKWHSPDSIQCVPDTFVIAYGSHVQRAFQLMVLRGANHVQDRLVVSPTVPWIRIDEQRTIGGGRVQVKVQVIPASLPKNYRGHVLEAGIDGSEARSYVSAIVAS